jgi:hypothetical protein
MRVITATILFLLVLTQIFSKWLLVAEYAVNKDYIAKNLCENKEKPILKCQGKCQLMKKMAAETENDNSGSGNSTAKSSLPEVLPFEDLSNISVKAPSPIQVSHNSFYILKAYTAPNNAVFHPPLS